MMFTYNLCVLAMILSLWTGVSRGQCPEKCYCDGHRVRCRGQQLSTIPLSLSNATILDLSMSMLESLPEDAFKGWPNLTGLDLSSNRLRNISRATFRGLAKLRWLYLTSNTLEYIDDGVFEGMSDLEQLNLHDNRLRNISRETFIGLAKLRILHVSSNALESIDDGVFEGMPDLKELFLGYNILGFISRAAFSGLTQLNTLSLSGCHLDSIEAGVFEEMPNITRLYLRNNRIRNISRPAFRDMTHLKELYLSNNPLICNCQLRWLIETVQDSKSKLTTHGAVCSEPAHLKGRNIVNVIQSDLNCETQANNINECAPAPCKNGATCTNLQNAYSCTCSLGWQGNNCDQDASISQAPTSQSAPSSTTESLKFVYIGIVLGVIVAVLINAAVIVIITKKIRRMHNTPSYPMDMPLCVPSQIHSVRECETLADRGLMESDNDRMTESVRL